MTEKIITLEANSLEEARQQARSKIPAGYQVISEQVISDGGQKTIRAVANTTPNAFVEAQKELPSNANIVERKELNAPEQKIANIEAFDENVAEGEVKRQLGNTWVVKNVKLIAKGRRGFLGIGRKPNQYEFELFRQATVEIVYKTKAKISVTVDSANSILLKKEIQKLLDEKNQITTELSRVQHYIKQEQNQIDEEMLKRDPYPMHYQIALERHEEEERDLKSKLAQLDFQIQQLRSKLDEQ